MPSLIIITDIHDDHFDNDTSLELESQRNKKVVPKTVLILLFKSNNFTGIKLI